MNGQSQTHANQVHSAFAWVNDETGRAFVVMTDDEEATDTDIIEITNPSRPTFVAEYDFAPQPRQPLGAVHGDAVFIHDEVVKKINGRYVGLLSYWDGGYIQVDLTDPAKAGYIGDTGYAAVDPLLLKRTGTSLSPEANGHEAEFTPENRFFLATDEDFDLQARSSLYLRGAAVSQSHCGSRRRWCSYWASCAAGACSLHP